MHESAPALNASSARPGKGNPGESELLWAGDDASGPYKSVRGPLRDNNDKLSVLNWFSGVRSWSGGGTRPARA
jgi:hypothetical protein